MKILIAEFAVGTDADRSLIPEGAAMLDTLAQSFVRLGHEVYYPTAGTRIDSGTPLESTAESFLAVIEKQAKECDAGLLIAPDGMLPELNRLLEENTENLGCSPESAACCADKLKCTKILEKAGIAAPKIVERPETGKRYILKPRSGCGAEDTCLVDKFEEKEGLIACEYIEGMHLSVSLIAGKKTLPLTVNRQFIEFIPQDRKSGECDTRKESGECGARNESGGCEAKIEYEKCGISGKSSAKSISTIKYNGSLTPFETPRREELIETALAAAKVLKCSGYIGVDIVLADRPYVVDVNPRPTASLFGISRIMKEEIGELLLQNRFGTLPDSVTLEGEYRFSKDRLGKLFG